MKKLFTLALTVSALTVASMTLFASDNSPSPTPTLPIEQTAPKSSDVCSEGLSPEDCTQNQGNCKGLSNGQGNGNSSGRGCCRN